MGFAPISPPPILPVPGAETLETSTDPGLSEQQCAGEYQLLLLPGNPARYAGSVQWR